MIGMLASEVLLEQVILVVLFDTMKSLLGSCGHRWCEAQGLVSIKLLLVLVLLALLRGVDVLGPSALLVLH